MTTESDIAELFDEVFAEYIESIRLVAHEGNCQADDHPYELLNDGVRKHFDLCLSILVKLYDEYIKPENAHVENALEFIPLFGVFGMWIGAQLGVTQETYNVMVNYYLTKLDLLED